MSNWIFWLAVGALVLSLRANFVLGLLWWRGRRALKAERGAAETLRGELATANGVAESLRAELATIRGDLRCEEERGRMACPAEGRLDSLMRLIAVKEAEGLALTKSKRFPEALRRLWEVYGIAMLTRSPGTVASALHNIALVTARLGDPEGAVALTEEALRLACGEAPMGVSLDGVPDGTPHAMPETSRRTDPRVALYEQHLKVFREVVGTRKANAKQQEASALLSEGRVDEAVAGFREAAQIAELEGNNPHLKVSNLINCANVLGTCGQAEKALAILADARADAEELGPESEFLRTLIQTSTISMESRALSRVFLDHMARVREFGAADDFRNAERAARAAFTEAAKRFGPRHLFAAVAMDSIGVALNQQGAHEEALHCFERAVDIAGDWEERAASVLPSLQGHLDLCRDFLGIVPPEGNYYADEET